MKKILPLILLMLGLPTLSEAGFRPGYYDAMDGKKCENLKKAVKECVASHQTLSYSQLPGYWQYTDVYPEMIDNARRWWEMYSDEICLIYEGQSPFQSFSSYGMNREHSVPKSWWKRNGSVEYTPAYSDMWNLYPSNGPANMAKSNYPFGITDRPTFDNGVTRVGPPRAGYGGGCSSVFEPDDEYKGDFARTIFYMAIVYDDINWVINYMFRTEAYPTLVPWACNMLLQWSRTDRVSQKEIDRNNLVEQYQGNRNPFVDFPELAEYIWGVRMSETFILSEQENTDPTPPITGDPEITEPINGEYLDFGTTAVGNSMTRALQIRGVNFTESLSVRITGADRTLFTPETSSIQASILNANGGYLLNITYQPPTTGTHEAAVILYDGGLEGSVKVNLKGSAEPRPEMTSLIALEASDITDYGYTANWAPASGIADYYVLTRVRYAGDSEEVETYETGETSFRISDRDVNTAESYMVQYSRLGIISPISNTIFLPAGTGINSIQTAPPFRAFGMKEGIRIHTGNGEIIESLSVYNAQGGLHSGPCDVSDGEIIALPSGLYILRAPGHLSVKVIVP